MKVMTYPFETAILKQNSSGKYPIALDLMISQRWNGKILVINENLPVFPGGGMHEYLNTMGLNERIQCLGLVSMAHTQNDLEKSEKLASQGVDLFLWKSPHIRQNDFRPRPLHPWVLKFHSLLSGSLRILTAPQRGLPADFGPSLLGFRNMADPIWQAMVKAHWQALVVIQSNYALILDYLPRQRTSILVLHDVRSLVYWRQSHTVRNPFRRWHLERQARRYFQLERRYCRIYDLIIAVSENDADWVRRHYDPKCLAVVPIPIDLDYFAPQSDVKVLPERIVFTGMMNHPPNEDAAIFFAREILPEIQKTRPYAEFFVVGKNPSPRVLDLQQLRGVTVTGAVLDIRPYLAEAVVIVVPLRFGSGVRNKILEAWGMQKAIVSTTIGAEGLIYEAGRHLLIADNAPSFASCVIDLLSKPSLRESISRDGREIASQRHNPEKVATLYLEAIRDAALAKKNSKARIALDLRWMLPGVAGGLENLARSFIHELIRLDSHNQYTLLMPACCRHDFDLRSRDNFKIAPHQSPGDLFRHAWGMFSNNLHQKLCVDYWRSDAVKQFIKLAKLDADWIYSFPGYIQPDLYPLRQILVVPDIQHEYHPEFFSEKALDERRRVYGDSIQRADHICAISEFTRQTLIEKLGVSPNKITTTHLAADPIYYSPPNSEADQLILRKYHLKPGYLFFPGHTWRHKNHRAAIEALYILKTRFGFQPQLVCTGGQREAHAEIMKFVDQCELTSQFRFLGYTAQVDLVSLYRMAACLIFPSYFEGFGMPVLEAMACRCPVVCSNTSSLPEIAGESALYCQPDDYLAWAKAILQVCTDKDKREALVEAGNVQAARFNWREYTLKTLQVFYRMQNQFVKGEI